MARERIWSWVEVLLWQDAGMPWLLLMGSTRLVTAHVWSLDKVFTLYTNGGDHPLYIEYGQLTITCVKWICNMLSQINSTLCQKVLMTQKPIFMLDVYLPCTHSLPLCFSCEEGPWGSNLTVMLSKVLAHKLPLQTMLRFLQIFQTNVTETL